MHRSKRQFQPSITSYFARADSSYDSSSDPHALSEQGLSSLPTNVQASLLTVGMRVRKSVPEGYKTHKTIPAPTAYSMPPTMARVVTESAASYSAYAGSASKSGELLPFCGIHKIGGYTTQPAYDIPSNCEPVDAHTIGFSANDFHGSQESDISTISTGSVPPTLPNTHKRRFSEDEDEELDTSTRPRNSLFSINTNLSNFSDDDLQVSPCTAYPVSRTAMPTVGAARPVARPKSRRKGSSSRTIQRRGAFSEEGTSMVTDEDFDDADFLEPYEDVEMEMGGV